MQLLTWLWEVAAYIPPFLFVLGIIIFVHEMGHFLVARWCDVAVDAFSLGFGPELFGWNDKHGTRWRVAAIPLGGYVKFAGDENAASVPDHAALDAMDEHERRTSFYLKPLWQRAAIVAAGPAANFILAAVIFSVFFMISGRSMMDASIDVVQPESPAAAAGFEAGDVITGIDGRTVEAFGDVLRTVSGSAGETLQFTVLRDGQEVPLTATPEQRNLTDRFGNPYTAGYLGVGAGAATAVSAIEPGSVAAEVGLQPRDVIIAVNGSELQGFADLDNRIASAEGPLELTVNRNGTLESLTVPAGAVSTAESLGVSSAPLERTVRRQEMGPLQSVVAGVEETAYITQRTVEVVYGVITLQQPADQFGGPLRVAKISGEMATLGFDALFALAAMLSVSIGLINLMPIPMLDGGHLLFYAIEAVRGRPLSLRAQDVGFRVGLALVLLLMIFATYNDVLQLTS